MNFNEASTFRSDFKIADQKCHETTRNLTARTPKALSYVKGFVVFIIMSTTKIFTALFNVGHSNRWMANIEWLDISIFSVYEW